MTVIRPTTEQELCDAIADAARDGRRLSIRGGGSKADVGAPVEAAILDMRGFSGIVDYDPPELVLTVRPGTPLAEVRALVAEHRQMLAFDPFDHGPLFGRLAGDATIGGVVAAGIAGSQRLAMGGARDHLLGLRAVSGRAEIFVAGAKVVKNVTGYDLPKLLAGSWGRLAAMTELTLKVLPAPRTRLTLLLHGLGIGQAVAAMSQAMGSGADVAAAAHLPGERPVTAFRLQGFPASVAERAAGLRRLLAEFGPMAEAEDALWDDLRTLSPLPLDLPLWRINIPPSAAPGLADDLGGRLLLDWAGGLVWAATDAEAETVRAAAAGAQGHAMLIRAPAELRSRVPAFHPPAPGVAALEARVRRAFDPSGLFETGRF